MLVKQASVGGFAPGYYRCSGRFAIWPVKGNLGICDAFAGPGLQIRTNIVRRIKTMKWIISITLVLILAASLGACAGTTAPVHVLYVNDQIDPATADYVRDGINAAQEDGAQAVLIVMDTPGGAITSMQKIVQAFFAAKIPVIVYVGPGAAMAGSAGTMITMAADVAAMSPESSIGAASPVSGGPGEEGKEMGATMKRKVTNFFSKYARSIAEKHGRNGAWAEKAVREAASYTAKEALRDNVIDYVAPSVHDLMKDINGKQVKLASGRIVTLHSADAALEEKPMGAWTASCTSSATRLSRCSCSFWRCTALSTSSPTPAPYCRG